MSNLCSFSTFRKAVVSPRTPKIGRNAPVHRLGSDGTYIVTAGTYHKEHHFRGRQRLDFLEANLLRIAKEFGWQLEAWAVFSNHYHFVAQATPDGRSLCAALTALHSLTAREVNRLDANPGRKVWHNYWDTELTYEKPIWCALTTSTRTRSNTGSFPLRTSIRGAPPPGSSAWRPRRK